MFPQRGVKDFESEYLTAMKEKYAKEMADLASGKLTDEAIKAMETTAAEVSKRYE